MFPFVRIKKECTEVFSGNKSILLITEPITSSNSVQIRLLESIADSFKESRIGCVSPYIDGDATIKLEKHGINTYSLYNYSEKHKNLQNEANAWLFSYFREALFSSNSRKIKKIIKERNHDIIINMSTTVPVESDFSIVQGLPLCETLENISKSNLLVKKILYLFSPIMRFFDKKVILKAVSLSNSVYANSDHIRRYYVQKGFKISGKIYTMPDMSNFVARKNGKEKYVLTYVGKETDIEPLEEMSASGIKIIGFGNKIPVGMSETRLKQIMDFKGYVDSGTLNDLYSNALFTAFPFTEEPFGWVPLESMKCGTPVLTYNKQGPSETVIDEVTGWLVNNRHEFVRKAKELWDGRIDLNTDDCIARYNEIYAQSLTGLSKLSRFVMEVNEAELLIQA